MKRLDSLLLISAIIVFTCILHGHYTKGKSVSTESTPPEPLSQKKDIIDILKKYFTGFAEELGKKATDKLFKSKDNCKKTKAKKLEPSAAKFDSPLEAFGYPFFQHDNNNHYTFISPGVSLSTSGSGNGQKFKNPVMAGSRDFYFAGDRNDIKEFFNCFEAYEVIGQEMQETGHWLNKTGKIKIQVQDEATYKIPNGATLFDMMVKMTLDRIIKELDPKKIVTEKITYVYDPITHLFGDTTAQLKTKFSWLKSNFEKARKWIPEDPEIIDGIKKILDAGGIDTEPKSMLQKLKDFFKKNKDKEGDLNVWKEKKNLKKKGKVIGVITMYPKPNNGVRTTYNTGKSVVTMKEIGKALE
jgi:hypothetical protein